MEQIQKDYQNISLTDAEKDAVALAIILWRDFCRSSNNQRDSIVGLNARILSKKLGVEDNYDAIMPKVPPMKWEPC